MGKEALERQQLAKRNNVAPSARHPFIIQTTYDNKPWTWYGFLTEVAERVGDEVFLRRMIKEQEALWNRLEELGLIQASVDLHEYNIGVLDGRLVCIDFVY